MCKGLATAGNQSLIHRSDTPVPGTLASKHSGPMIAQNLPGHNLRHSTASIDYAPIQKPSKQIHQRSDSRTGDECELPGARGSYIAVSHDQDQMMRRSYRNVTETGRSCRGGLRRAARCCSSGELDLYLAFHSGHENQARTSQLPENSARSFLSIFVGHARSDLHLVVLFVYSS
jgi:hypothetical protein